METHYTVEKHTQILIALMKFHGIRKVVASPGTTNITLLASLQSDPFFEIYSSVDERSGAFIACGLSAESGDPVALTCTGATASRNYVPGLTEAFYRKLPILAITSSQHPGHVGNAYSQAIDRSQQMADLVNESVQVDCVYTEEDEWACSIAINKAMIALTKNGGGPAHINLVTTYNKDFSAEKLPAVKGIRYIGSKDNMPSLNPFKRIAILVGVHEKWNEELTKTVDRFCELYNAVVLMYHACNYKGEYGVNHAVMLNMRNYKNELNNAELVIYIGAIPRYLSGMKKPGYEMWRVNPDGIIRDPEKMLTKVFAMEEEDFFHYYVDLKESSDIFDDSHDSAYARAWQSEYERVIALTPELPMSNVWVAKNTIDKIPDGSVLHMAGSNTARAWNFFKLPKTVECYSNDGTMGIDGQVSALVGESLAFPERLHFGVVGDLTFFYDMNSIGNRHVGRNFRLIVINNGIGAEFRIYSHLAYQFGEDGKKYMAAGGHYGNRSRTLLHHYAEDLGFEYLSADTKEEYLTNLDRFLSSEMTDKPMLFEVFTNEEDESYAIHLMNYMAQDAKERAKNATKNATKNAIKSVVGDKGVATVKKLLKH